MTPSVVESFNCLPPKLLTCLPAVIVSLTNLHNLTGLLSITEYYTCRRKAELVDIFQSTSVNNVPDTLGQSGVVLDQVKSRHGGGKSWEDATGLINRSSYADSSVLF